MSDKESTASGPARKPPVETAALISLVRARPCLWDRAHAHYRHRLHKERAWAEVCLQLEPALGDMTRADRHEFGNIIVRRWNNIRDCYKKARFGSTKSPATGRPYMYAELLTFLDSIYENRKRKIARFENALTTDDHEEWLSEVFVDINSTAPEPKKAKVEFRPKDADARTDGDEGIISVLVNLIEREEDEDRAFFKSIIPTVKSLPDEDRFLFKLEVMKLLNSWKQGGRRLAAMKQEIPSPDSDTE